MDHRAIDHEKTVASFLKMYSDKKVLDVGCGYGRFAKYFDHYVGLDFSEEMLLLAQKNNPGKRYCLGVDIEEQFDVIFCVIALSSLGMTAEEFNEKWKKRASLAVMVFEIEQFYIFPKL